MKYLIKKIILEQLDEALQDELPQYMIDAIKKNNPNVADVFLNADVPKHTELIPNVKVEINEPQITKDFIKDIQKHFSDSIETQFKKTKLYKESLKFKNFLFKAFDNNQIYIKILDTIFGSNANVYPYGSNTIKGLSLFYSKEFPLLQGKDNNDVDNPIFSKNKSNIFGFIKSINTAFPQYKIDLNAIMNDRIFQGLREPIMNFDENVNDLANSKLYLYITDKPADILRMSVSNFYSSCQNLYSGSHNEKLLSNVFDENSKIAFLIFDTPYVDNQGNKHPFTPIARTIVRVGENNKIMFDKTYPTKMEEDFYNILEKYTQLRNQGSRNAKYPYKYVGLPAPYMDRYKIKSIGGENGLEDNPRAVALADKLGFDINELEEVSGAEFSIHGDTYVVYTEDEADEYARDYLRDTWTEYIGDSTTFYNLVETYKILNKNAVYSVLEIDDKYLEETGYSLKEYLEGVGIDDLDDFNKILKREGVTYWQWYREGVTYNLDNLIKYFGGMGEVRILANSPYDGEEYYNNGYYIYRTD